MIYLGKRYYLNAEIEESVYLKNCHNEDLEKRKKIYDKSKARETLGKAVTNRMADRGERNFFSSNYGVWTFDLEKPIFAVYYSKDFDRIKN